MKNKSFSFTDQNCFMVVFISALILLKPFDVHAVLSPLNVSVVNGKTGKAVAGATYTIFTSQGKVAAKGSTDKDGKIKGGAAKLLQPGASGRIYITKKGLKSQVVQFGPGNYVQTIKIPPIIIPSQIQVTVINGVPSLEGSTKSSSTYHGTISSKGVTNPSKVNPESVKSTKNTIGSGVKNTKKIGDFYFHVNSDPEILYISSDIDMGALISMNPYDDCVDDLDVINTYVEMVKSGNNPFQFGGLWRRGDDELIIELTRRYGKKIVGIDAQSEQEYEHKITELLSDKIIEYQKKHKLSIFKNSPVASKEQPEEVNGGAQPVLPKEGVNDLKHANNVKDDHPRIFFKYTDRLINLRGQTSRSSLPNDPFCNSRNSWGQDFDDQWALKRIGLGSKTQVDSGSNWVTKDDRPVIVAVIDSGCDLSHPELQGKIWINDDEIPGNGIDDDKNGFIDDVNGWNFIDESNTIEDYNGHGTVNSGIIAAETDNNIGIAGVNSNARIMVIKALDFELKGNNVHLGRAILYAVNNGARVINISIGGQGTSTFVQMACNYAYIKGAIIVAASGNEGIETADYTPAGLREVITVAATDMKDKRTNYSNWGQQVDIAAPGADILSLRARGTDLLVLIDEKGYQPGSAVVGKDGMYYRVSGTSFAAPLVSGVASLILSKNPKLNSGQVKRMLLSSAEDIETPGWDQYTGFGLLNGAKALKADPDTISVAKISGIEPVKKKDRMVLQVRGTAFATNIDRYWVELGLGEQPKQWKQVAKIKQESVIDSVLSEIEIKEITEPGNWSVRVLVRNNKGETKEARGSLDIR